jgi:hypothetical protein
MTDYRAGFTKGLIYGSFAGQIAAGILVLVVRSFVG